MASSMEFAGLVWLNLQKVHLCVGVDRQIWMLARRRNILSSPPPRSPARTSDARAEALNGVDSYDVDTSRGVHTELVPRETGTSVDISKVRRASGG